MWQHFSNSSSTVSVKSIFINSKMLRLLRLLIAQKVSWANRFQLPLQFSNLNDFKLKNFLSDPAKSLNKQSQSPIAKCSKFKVTESNARKVSFGNDLIEVNDWTEK